MCIPFQRPISHFYTHGFNTPAERRGAGFLVNPPPAPSRAPPLCIRHTRRGNGHRASAVTGLTIIRAENIPLKAPGGRQIESVPRARPGSYTARPLHFRNIGKRRSGDSGMDVSGKNRSAVRRDSPVSVVWTRGWGGLVNSSDAPVCPHAVVSSKAALLSLLLYELSAPLWDSQSHPRACSRRPGPV